MAATVLIGFMGAGKSSLARRLSPGAVDADALLEQHFGKPVEEVFDTDGEAVFREAEERIVCEALRRAQDGDVVALGGGAIESERIRAALEPHTVVLLEVSEATAWSRASGRGRPLARDPEGFSVRFAARAGLYEAAADAFLPEAPLDSLVAAVDAARRSAGLDARMAWAHTGGGDYPVYVGRGILGAGLDGGGDGRAFAISDSNVADLYGGRIGDLAGLVEIPAGEEHKTLATAERVWHALAAQGVTRADRIIALGGGVVGDLAGFCAATYQRGVPVVQVPTSVVAQVDSALGGKTGIDLPEAKNYVGAYHQPSAVIADTTTLATLPAAEHAAGYAEIVKTALIAGGGLWSEVCDVGVDDGVLFQCARTKLAVVAADERDGGRRQVLNLGHTVGHALETVTGYARLRHGEAVGLGLLAALRLSGQAALRDQVAELLAGAGLPTTVDGVEADAVVAATKRDKKRLGEAVPFVLVRAPGDVVHGEAVGDDDLRAAVAELLA